MLPVYAVIPGSVMCQQTDGLNVVFVEQHLAICFSVIIYAEFKSD